MNGHTKRTLAEVAVYACAAERGRAVREDQAFPPVLGATSSAKVIHRQALAAGEAIGAVRFRGKVIRLSGYIYDFINADST